MPTDLLGEEKPETESLESSIGTINLNTILDAMIIENKLTSIT